MGGAFGNMIRRHAAASLGSNLSDKINADGSIKDKPAKKKSISTTMSEQLTWRDHPPTANQLRAITNMSAALDIDEPMPVTKGQACDKIAELTELFKATSYSNSRKGYLPRANDDDPDLYDRDYDSDWDMDGW